MHAHYEIGGLVGEGADGVREGGEAVEEAAEGVGDAVEAAVVEDESAGYQGRRRREG